MFGLGGRQVFGLIDEAEVIKGDDGKTRYIDMVFGRRMFEAILEGEILTYNDAYFSLSPSERRAYELARKHCGEQPYWHMSLEGYYRKFGSRSELPRFARDFEKLIENDRIPDYRYDLDRTRELIIVRPTAA
jgi:hypothetical protein